MKTSEGIKAVAAAIMVLLSVVLSGCNGLDGHGNTNPVCLVTKPGEAPIFQCK